MMKTTILVESLDLHEAQLDNENRTVRQTLIRAGMSRNRRFYGEDVLRAAAPLFEDVKTYANHPSKAELKDRPERSVRDVTGWLSGVVFEGDRLVGTRHFTRTQAGMDAWALVEDVVNRRAPATLLGASINAIGKARAHKFDDGDGLLVEAIDAVNSVDDVTSPAAGGGFDRLLASDGGLTVELLRAIELEDFREARPDLVEALKKEWQVIRQTEAFKTLQSEAEHLRAELTEAQEQLRSAESARDAALAEARVKALELELERMLRAARLPAVYEEDLRARLMNEPIERWTQIIETERKKASTNAPRVPVSGAGQQVHSSVATVEASNPLLYYAKVATPEEHARFMESLRSKRG